MKKALPNTKVTAKLRKSNYKDEWYLIIESYPVYKRGSKRASRVVESINRTISTPIWDKSSIARILPDGTFNYKPKRDLNGIIQCRSTIDQEACIYADNVRKLRQREYDSAILLKRMKSLHKMNGANRTLSSISIVLSANDILIVPIQL